ncbi:hypothetical protein RRF57_000715 [Xylaria bambusicola]|uniref:NACHT domain-containing protein n=1 Tax=Xylaria bambusicola TaxID=326684 RepID=A0AAN7UAA9_9PEZI
MQEKAEEDITSVLSLVNAIRDEAADVQNQQKILKSLRYPEMEVRHKSIKAAHAKTFEWILDDHTFAKWLENGEGIYWIRGKAGSGKSTIMRFLVENSKTSKLLSAWAGQRKLVLASYFFWKSGTSMQKSLNGLLRTLLFQVLRQIPPLIEKLFPLKWKERDLSIDPFSDDEIIRAIKALPLETSLPIRFCFFIDGLDEYTMGAERYYGDFQEPTQMLKALCASSVIKICVSSRPWTPFERAFGSSPNKLQLENLTRSDIRAFVVDKLECDRHFRELASVDSRCKIFCEEIVLKAQGVFLWVYLVIQSLLNGASALDDFDDLQRRLDSTPADLEDYFKHMLQTIEPAYWEQTAHILQVTADARSPLPLLVYDFLDHEKQNPNYAIKLSASDALDLDIEKIVKKTKIRLDARCRDLLEVYYDFTFDSVLFGSCYVQFSHRTVRDFFMETDFLVELMKTHQVDFDSLISLCRMMLAFVKVLDAYRRPILLGWFYHLMEYVRSIEKEFIEKDGSTMRPSSINASRLSIAHELLDGLDLAGTYGDRHEWGVVHLKGTEYREHGPGTMLACAVEEGLLLYVKAKLDTNLQSVGQRTGRSLLDCALRPPSDKSQYQTGLKPASIALVDLILSKGADPNEEMDTPEGATPWSLFLMRCTIRDYPRTFHDAELYQILHLMISYGADWRLLRGLNGRRLGHIVIQDGQFMVHDSYDTELSTQAVTSLNALLASKRSEDDVLSLWQTRAWLLFLFVLECVVTYLHLFGYLEGCSGIEDTSTQLSKSQQVVFILLALPWVKLTWHELKGLY